MRLQGRLAVVTGAASGLGAATARRLAADGATVVVADIDDGGTRRVAIGIADAGGDAEPTTVDVTHEGEVAAMFEAITEQHGRLDVLVCSAAVETRASIVDTTDAAWRRVLDVNLKGPFLCLKHGLPLMVGSGGGSVILLGSVLGAIGSPGYAAYCTSKGALVNLAKQAAIEHAPDGIRVNVVSPSACETGLFLEMVSQAPDPEAIKRMVADRTPMGRLGTEADVIETIMFLTSPESSYISGTTIPLDGGLAAPARLIDVHDGWRVLDADAHVIEPAGLFGDAAPAGVDVIDLPGTTPMVPCGEDPDSVADFLVSGCAATEYLRCMDREGIDAVVLYPSIGLFVPFLPSLSPAESARACRAYNEWLAEYCATDPARLAGAALVPTADIELAAREASHAATLGLPTVMVRPNPLYGRDLGDRGYDPLYDVLEALDLTLSVHEGLGLMGPTIGRDRSDTFALRHALSHPMEQMAAMGSLMMLGALERHPGLHVAFLESGTGWLPYWLARLDAHAQWMAETETRELALAPSEYFARQCVICTDPDDPLAAWVVSEVGADHVMWASDFPHPDALYPNAVVSFLHESSEHGMAEADVTEVLWDTPVKWYGWPSAAPPVVPQAQGSSRSR